MAARERNLPSEIGRYRVVRLHGQGAMGRVLLAHDTILDRDVAVKLLRDDLGLSEEQEQALLDRMRQEARAAARVSHPNIVALHDMGEDPEVGLYLVFEYLEGSTLKERLERGPLGAFQAAKLAVEIGSALTTAHEKGVLHRDIKPDNIIMTEAGGKIADFGIARVPDSTLTMGGGLLGTPAYSAPECISDGRFSSKSDQFSMAATLYEAISGKRAFPGEDAVTVASRIGTDEPPPIAAAAGVDLQVDGVLSRALSKDPKLRFDSCEAFGVALSDALRNSPRSAMPTLPDEAHRQVADEAAGVRVARAGAGGIAVGAMLAIVGFQLTAHLRQDDAKREETSVPKPVLAEEPAGAEPVAWLSEKPKAPKTPAKPAATANPKEHMRKGNEGGDSVDSPRSFGRAEDAGRAKDGGAGRSE